MSQRAPWARAPKDKLQATYERDGTFENFGDGTYRYTYATDVNNPDPDMDEQAKAEGLNLDYEPGQTHRVSIQFDGGPNPVNPFFDWIPETGETSGIFNYQVVADRTTATAATIRWVSTAATVSKWSTA